MTDGVTIVAGFPIPSTSPAFLAVVAVHVGLGLLAVVTGVLAMLSPKGPGRHPRSGSLYVWSLAGLALTSSGLAVARWPQDAQFFAMGLLALASAAYGRRARRLQRPGWKAHHIVGMGLSYMVMLTAFYVDNGKNLPLWRALPALAYWIAPGLVGLPIMALALSRHARRGSGRG